jgi:pilus assembly protein Flp/PilA
MRERAAAQARILICLPPAAWTRKRKGVSVRVLTELIRRLVRCEEGQTLTEYGLLVFFIAVAAILAVTALGVNIGAVFQNIADRLAAI